jgi:DHA2 family multidrug resistance protein-like MFS transporter
MAVVSQKVAMSTSASRQSAAQDGLSGPQLLRAVTTLLIAVFMAALDTSIANTALPTIARDVNATPAASIWVVNAYQLAVTVSLLPFASIGDIFAYRRVYFWGLVVFTTASLLCAMSDSLATLTLARILQGFGAAGVMSVNGALIRAIYPRVWMGRGVGINATIGSISSAAGPSVAAAILAVAHWPWLFAVNVPIGLIAIPIAWRALPRARRVPRRFDTAGAGLSALTLGLLITGIDGVAHGAPPTSVAIELVTAVVLGFMLVTRQMAQPSPLVPVDLMRVPLFALSVCASVAAFMAQGMSYVTLPFLFENTLGRSQVETGLLLTPWPLTVALIATATGRLSDRYPVGVLSSIGLAVMAVGLMLVATMPADPTTLNIMWRTAICGLGFGFFNTPNNKAILTSAPLARSGGASGMQATARLFGQTLGAALVALIFSLAHERGPTISLTVAAAMTATAGVISLMRLRGPRPAR